MIQSNLYFELFELQSVLEKESLLSMDLPVGIEVKGNLSC